MDLEATTKRARASGGSGSVAGEPDRLSTLPDCLLHTIMSFMKARQVVQTCVLSTRWKHLWRSVPCLDLDLDEFKDDEKSDSDDDEDKYWEWEHFEDFAVNLMLRHNIALLDSFRLHVNRATAPSSGSKCAATWLRRAMKYCAPDPGIQREGLSSNSWRLKRLHLCNILLDNRFAKHVSSSCPSLEDLELISCRVEFHAITSHSLKNLILKYGSYTDLSDITLPTLKSLVIDGGSWRGGLVITAPAVAYLHLAVEIGVSDAHISLNEIPSIEKASILLCGYWGGIAESRHGHDQFKLLCSVSNVTCLELSNSVTMVLFLQLCQLFPFIHFINMILLC